MIDPALWNATLVARRDANERVAVLHVRPDSGAVQPFTPGQFVQLGWPKERADGDETGRVRWVKRSYSLASAPHEREAYELCLALVSDGLLTPKLWPLCVGDRLWCDSAPKGFFTLERIPSGCDLVMIATGTGIAPFVSMARAFRGTNRWRTLVVIHGAREASDLAYDEELRELARCDASVRYVPVLSRAGEGARWSGLRGHVQATLEPSQLRARADIALDSTSSNVLLCGNPAMIQDVRELLAPRGFTLDTPRQPGNLHFEKYW